MGAHLLLLFFDVFFVMFYKISLLCFWIRHCTRLTGVEEGHTAAGRQRHVALTLQVAVALSVVAEVAQGPLVVVEAAPLSGSPAAQLRAGPGDLR